MKKLASFVLALVLVGEAAFSQENSSASPGGRFTVEMAGPADAKARQLVLKDGAKVLGTFDAEGSFLSVNWSPALRWVAINNRIGNSGDYLWVLDLSSGNAPEETER